MKTIPSSEFRKTYGKLTEPHVVTVSGHAIGFWSPWIVADENGIVTDPHRIAEMPAAFRAQHTPIESFRSIRPVPKPGRK